MPMIVAYPVVLEQLLAQGLKCHYHNSGAFGFAADQATISRGWIGPEDGSIRESARAFVRQIEPPFAQRLASLLRRAHETLLAGPVWVMPKSHWAFELEYGNRSWMPDLLAEIGVNSAKLAGLNNAAAIAFSAEEEDALGAFVERLLSNLKSSDFMLVFPGRQTICTIHSHVQLWWTTADATVAAGLDDLVP
jgi:hypothetical protein